MNIQVSIKQVYGNSLIYPDCERAREFVALTGKKTLNASDIASIRKLGFHVSVVVPSVFSVPESLMEEKELLRDQNKRLEWLSDLRASERLCKQNATERQSPNDIT